MERAVVIGPVSENPLKINMDYNIKRLKQLIIIILLLTPLYLHGQTLSNLSVGVVSSDPLLRVYLEHGAYIPYDNSLDSLLGAYWNFEETGTGADTFLIDQVGSSNGTWTATPSWQETGINNFCVDLTGDEHASVGINTLTYQSFTVSVWVKGNGVDFLISPVSNQDGNLDGWNLYTGNAATIRGRVISDEKDMVTQGDDVINDGTWHNVILTYSGTNAYLYVDNVLDASNSGGGSIDYTNCEMRIGANSGVFNEWIGFLDEIGLWSRVLTSAERATLQTKFYPSWE